MTIWSPELSDYAGPRYRALAAAIADAVESGALAPGERLPTHRALAEALGVTVGTVTRGYAQAERHGLVEGRVGSGTYVRSEEPPGVWRFGIPRRDDDRKAIDFGLSFPVPTHRERMLADTLRVIADDPAALSDALSYQPEAGLPRHRAVLADWLRSWGTPIDVDETLLCLGGLHGVHLALQALTRPGDTVASAGLTYPGLIAAARQLGLRHAGLGMDDEGIRPDAFAALCQQQPPRALYCIPNQNNPTTAAMSGERRQAILALARRHDVMVIEDEVHLVAADERPPNLVEMDPRRVVYVSGCSKILAGGLRVGVVRAPPALLARMADGLRSHCWMAPPLNAEIACRWIESGAAAELALWQRREIGRRQALVGKLLRGRDVKTRPYGFNVWLSLPEQWRAAEFVDRCEAEGVLLKSGEPFAVGSFAVPQAVRLCISMPRSREAVQRGLETVGRLLDERPGGAVATL